MTSPDFRIVDAATAGIEALCDGFNRGFRDYKYASFFDPPGMELFLERSAMRLEDCAVMLVEEGGRMQGVGAALLAVEDNEAWCGGLAVAPPHRRRGGAEALMEAIHRHAVRRSATIMRLEVLAQNEAARALYQRLGYREQRELLLWEREATADASPASTGALRPADVLDVVEHMYDWHGTVLSWQRRRTSLRRAFTLMDALTLDDSNGDAVGYVLYHHNRFGRNGAESVHLFDIAVSPDDNVVDRAHALTSALVAHFPSAKIVLVNEPKGSVLNPALAAAGFVVADQQFELTRFVSS